MFDVDKITKFIAVHAKWKHQLKTAIDTAQSDRNVNDVAADDGCEFGIWLLSLPKQDQSTAHWQKVRALHAEFHKSAAEVLAMALAGKKEEATAEMAFGGNFAKVSANLTVAMTEWRKSLQS
jgi:methyl-accepting chemotaxis protein